MVQGKCRIRSAGGRLLATMALGAGCLVGPAHAAHATDCTVSTWTGLVSAFRTGGTAKLCNPIDDAGQHSYQPLMIPPGGRAELDLAGWPVNIKNAPAGSPGISVPPDAMLTIGDSTPLHLGRLTATGGGGRLGGGGGAGIGGRGGIGAIQPLQGTDGAGAGAVHILGGSVIATGGDGSNNDVYYAGGGGGGAGIGGGGAGAGDGPNHSRYVTGGNAGTLILNGGRLTALGGSAGNAGNYGEPGAGGGAGLGGGGGGGTGHAKFRSGFGGNGGVVSLLRGGLRTVGGSSAQYPHVQGGGGAGIGSGGGGLVRQRPTGTGGRITVVPDEVQILDSGPGLGGDAQSGNGQEPQQVMVTSTPPTDPALGGSYRVTVVSTFGTSGQPVVLSTPGPDNACTLGSDGRTVTFVAAGICTVVANQRGFGNGYDSAPTQTQRFPVR
ncbi:MAG TPA: hypothetical protein VHU88_07725 [Sporichthyaceae bacterium]|nr:hypothetical protein [Sporichthyaceae bacterium]